LAARKKKKKKKVDEVLKLFIGQTTPVATGQGYLVEEVLVPAGKETDYVFREKRYETWIPLEGEGVVSIFDGLPTDLRVGYMVMVPRKTKHKIINNSDTDFRMLVVQSGKVVEKESDLYEASEASVPNKYKRGIEL